MKILIGHFKRTRKYLVKDESKDFHCTEGVIKSEDMKEGSTAVSNTGKEFTVFSPTFIDLYGKIKRDAQIIPLKDVGRIITETGINKDSVIVDCGAGSGGLSCFLAGIAKKVTTYDIRDDFIAIVEKNKEFLGLSNLTIKKGDFYEGVDERDADVVTLDLPEPWKALGSAYDALKTGGFLMCYNPTIPQISDTAEAIRKDGRFAIQKIIEITEREWEFDKRKIRPISRTTIHSGFLLFSRKL